LKDGAIITYSGKTAARVCAYWNMALTRRGAKT